MVGQGIAHIHRLLLVGLQVTLQVVAVLSLHRRSVHHPNHTIGVRRDNDRTGGIVVTDNQLPNILEIVNVQTLWQLKRVLGNIGARDLAHQSHHANLQWSAGVNILDQTAAAAISKQAF